MPNFKVGQQRASKAAKHQEKMLPIVLELEAQGLYQSEIAEELAKMGFKTLSGGKPHQVMVHRLLRKAKALRTRGKLTPTAAGAALAQANQEAREPTIDEMMAQIGRERRAEMDHAIEMIEASNARTDQPPDIDLLMY